MNKTEHTLTFLFGLICGVVVGTALASLFVPRSGLETREQISERGIELQQRAEETVRKAQTVADQTVARVQTAAQELLGRSPANAEDGAASST